jgi:hypothetical protein
VSHIRASKADVINEITTGGKLKLVEEITGILAGQYILVFTKVATPSAVVAAAL